MFSCIYIWNSGIQHMLISRMTSVPLKLKFIWLSLQDPAWNVWCSPLSLSHHCLWYPPGQESLPWWSSDLDLINPLCGSTFLSKVVCGEGQWKSWLIYVEISVLHNRFIQKTDYSVTNGTEGIPWPFIFNIK